jgi:ClpP class serine protease
MQFDPLSLLWLFFIFSAIQPLIKQRMVEAQRLRLIKRIEETRNSRVITLIHRQESMALLGFPIARYIDIDDSEAVLRAIRLTPTEMPIDLIVHTPGGIVLAAEQIARALIRHRGKVTVFVPHYAMSGGTLIGLAADEIRMDEHAVLGPVDPQLGQYPAASILAAVEQKPVAEIDDETLILADMSRKALQQVRATVVDIMERNGVPTERAAAVAQELSTGKWTHDFPIAADLALDLGLPVQTGVPQEVYALMELYPQPGGRRPSVTYIPVPYRRMPAEPVPQPGPASPAPRRRASAERFSSET